MTELQGVIFCWVLEVITPIGGILLWETWDKDRGAPPQLPQERNE